MASNVSDTVLSAATAALTRSAAVLATVLLVGCAHAPTDPDERAAYERADDPAEPTNRTIFAGNQWVDRNALKPVARAYEDHVPDGVRRSVHNFVTNLKEPTILINDVLQANFTRAWVTTQRFVINTTVGGAGLFDVADGWGRPFHDADFGQTFGVWGIGSGPAVQLPLFGPSNVRDSVGKVVGIVANPLTFASGGAATAVEATGAAGGMVDGRAELLSTTDSLEKTSLDYYASLRSMMAQRRAAFVEEGKAGLTGNAPKSPETTPDNTPKAPPFTIERESDKPNTIKPESDKPN